MRSKSLLHLLTAAVWSAAAAAAGFWLLQVVGPSAVLGRPMNTVMLVAGPEPVQATAADWMALLGGTVANTDSAPLTAARYRLLGVVAGPQGGAALLSINDQPAKPYTLGSRVDDANLLIAVGPRHVVLGSEIQGGSRRMLELAAE